MRAHPGTPGERRPGPVLPQRQPDLQIGQVHAAGRRVPRLHRARVALQVDGHAALVQVVECETSVPAERLSDRRDVLAGDRVIDAEPRRRAATNPRPPLDAGVNGDQTSAVEQPLHLAVLAAGGRLRHQGHPRRSECGRGESKVPRGLVDHLPHSLARCAERRLQPVWKRQISQVARTCHRAPCGLGQSEPIQQLGKRQLALNLCERVRVGDRNAHTVRKLRQCGREKPRLLVRRQHHVDLPLDHDGLQRTEITGGVAGAAGAAVNPAGPPAEASQAERSRVEHLDVVTGGTETREDLPRGEARTLSEQHAHTGHPTSIPLARPDRARTAPTEPHAPCV